MKDFKWPVAILAFIITVALSVGGVYLRQRQLVDEPLVRRLHEIEAVEQIELTKQGDLLLVQVQLGYVNNFAPVYTQLTEETERLLGHKSFRIELVDGRNAKLDNAYAAVHLALYEAVQRGNFTEMNRVIGETLQGLGVSEHKVVVTENNIYFQAREGDKYLYAVIDRVRRSEEGERA